MEAAREAIGPGRLFLPSSFDPLASREFLVETWRRVSAHNHGSDPVENVIYQLRSITERLNLEVVFPRRGDLELELGSGDGSFLVEYARQNPNRNFLGVERLLGRMRKMERKSRRAGLSNLRGIRVESAYFLEYLLPARSVSALHVYFPDPWPKRKHRRHRLVNERFPAMAKNVLWPGGIVYLRTDDQDYFNQMLEVFESAAGFKRVETPGTLAAITTDFERDFNARGISTLRAAYQMSMTS